MRTTLAAHASSGHAGIRREDKSRWERRAPLAPQHVKQLVQRGIKVFIQPSNLRVFTDDEYREVRAQLTPQRRLRSPSHQAGAVVQEDLSPAHTIIAVKVRSSQPVP